MELKIRNLLTTKDKLAVSKNGYTFIVKNLKEFSIKRNLKGLK